jgi:signal transduction histidine kinase
VGLGLFLAKRILELHGGSIRVKSELGKSSEFVLGLDTK